MVNIPTIINFSRILIIFPFIMIAPEKPFLGALLFAVASLTDLLDGYIARKFKVSSEFGALFDIAGDRIVESVFWIYFTYAGMISFWIPLIIITRGFLSDNVRALAFRSGKTPFGKNTISRFSIDGKCFLWYIRVFTGKNFVLFRKF